MHYNSSFIKWKSLQIIILMCNLLYSFNFFLCDVHLLMCSWPTAISIVKNSSDTITSLRPNPHFFPPDTFLYISPKNKPAFFAMKEGNFHSNTFIFPSLIYFKSLVLIELFIYLSFLKHFCVLRLLPH